MSRRQNPFEALFCIDGKSEDNAVRLLSKMFSLERNYEEKLVEKQTIPTTKNWKVAVYWRRMVRVQEMKKFDKD